MKRLLKNIVSYLSLKHRGASAAEYVMIVSLIALTIILGLTALGGGINTTFTNIVGIVQGALGS
jgi:pilus assembly protein Flp/PilA